MASHRVDSEPRRIRRPLRPLAYSLWLVFAALATGMALAGAWIASG